ncbi:UDP-glucose 4-epimerase GalE [Deinococcus sp. SM5_A1]|uniref:UDP-glucose 4-epimerase GalE n=1 Tax=Deinococcus sp. SM5_A1 TaxID=3379094 RepID=UPI0038584B35
MKILVTGGAGFIGSTTCSALEDAGHTPVILDSLISGPAAFLRERIFYHGDIADADLIHRIFSEHPDIDATVHFAARIVVTESMSMPALYYRENVVGSLTLFETLQALGQKRIIFSSSASIYDSPTDLRVDEQSPLRPLSPYARSKRMTEEMLADLCSASQGSMAPVRAVALRYFNPIGADPALRSGPYIADPTHILGRLMGVAQGRTDTFKITGTDYATRDGTGLRDYIHIWDLALAHVAALEGFDSSFEQASRDGQPDASFLPINVGTGNGVTVRELVMAFQQASPMPIRVEDGPRRPGDSAGAYADTTRARKYLGWSAQLNVSQAMESAFAWELVREARLKTVRFPVDS